MGLYLKQNEPRTQLSSKVSADLAERLNKRVKEPSDKQQDVILDNQRPTTGGGVFWFIVIGLVVLAGAIYLMFIF